MMLEHPFDMRSDRDVLHRVTQQIADHPHAASMRNLHEHGEIRTVLLQDRVRRMPDPLPTEDPSTRIDLCPFGIEGVAAMTDPFRSKLPRCAMATSLHH